VFLLEHLLELSHAVRLVPDEGCVGSVELDGAGSDDDRAVAVGVPGGNTTSTRFASDLTRCRRVGRCGPVGVEGKKGLEAS